MKKRGEPELTAVGITCGIGSMLVGARQAGFKILGNVEWRKYYHAEDEHGRNTFRENFPGALFKHKADDLELAEIERLMGADLALGHPECGNFSLLNGVNKSRAQKLEDPSDIPLFVDLIAKFRPRFFVMDDLPRSFGAFPMSEYVRRLPDYDLFPEWVSNWGYGNVQKYRNRMFMLGAMKKEKWAFVPGEVEPGPESATLSAVIGDLPTPRRGSNYPNHDPAARKELAQKNLSMAYIGQRPTWDQVGEFARKNWPPGQSMNYHANDGTIKNKPGCKVERWEGPASVQCGAAYKIHPVRFENLTLRERARIQGFPDDFVFYGARLNDRGEFNPDRNVTMTKQTGKAMPVQFCAYVSRQIAAKIRGEEFKSSRQRIIRADPLVDEAKQWYCGEVGYADQRAACGSCWLYDRCAIRHQKYGVGEAPTVPAARVKREPVPRASRERKRKAKSYSPVETVPMSFKSGGS